MKSSKKIFFVLTVISFVLQAKAMGMDSSSSSSTSYIGNEQEDIIVAKNTTDLDFWIVIKYGGKLVSSPKGGLAREKGHGEEILFSGKIPANSSNNFNKKRYNRLTVRIFKNENNYKAYKSGVYARALSPLELAGLKEIVIIKIDQNYHLKLKYNFIGFACPICHTSIEQEDKVGIINPCGHKYHLDCINAWIAKKNICPECKINIINIITKNAEELE